jgi:hypothetical protein
VPTTLRAATLQEDFRAFLNAHFQPQAGPPVTNGDKPAAGAADPFEAELAAAAAAAGSAIEMAGSGGAGGAISQKTGAKQRRTSVRDKARPWLACSARLRTPQHRVFELD